jgi:hypothetical protein
VRVHLCEFFCAKQPDVAFDRASAAALIFRLQMQRVLHVEVEHVRIGGCVVRPVAELHDEQHTGHRIQLFGGPSHSGIKVLGQFLCGHQLQNGVPKQMLPPARETSISNRRKKAFELVKQACLSRIFQIPQLTAP